MTTRGGWTGYGPHPTTREEVDALLRQIQHLAARCDELNGRDADDPERVEAVRELDRLQWRLAAAARRAAEQDSGAAA